jgi:magnesium-transporting ATPase (P-type)
MENFLKILDQVTVFANELSPIKEEWRECNGVIDGPDLSHLNENQIVDILQKVCILARISPPQKKTITEHLGGKGDVIAVTGNRAVDGNHTALENSKKF